jgi:hypothetical protein
MIGTLCLYCDSRTDWPTDILSGEAMFEFGERPKQLNNSQEQPAITAKFPPPLSPKTEGFYGGRQVFWLYFFRVNSGISGALGLAFAERLPCLLLAASRETA